MTTIVILSLLFYSFCITWSCSSLNPIGYEIGEDDNGDDEELRGCWWVISIAYVNLCKVTIMEVDCGQMWTNNEAGGEFITTQF